MPPYFNSGSCKGVILPHNWSKLNKQEADCLVHRIAYTLVIVFCAVIGICLLGLFLLHRIPRRGIWRVHNSQGKRYVSTWKGFVERSKWLVAEQKREQSRENKSKKFRHVFGLDPSWTFWDPDGSRERQYREHLGRSWLRLLPKFMVSAHHWSRTQNYSVRASSRETIIHDPERAEGGLSTILIASGEPGDIPPVHLESLPPQVEDQAPPPRQNWPSRRRPSPWPRQPSPRLMSLSPASTRQSSGARSKLPSPHMVDSGLPSPEGETWLQKFLERRAARLQARKQSKEGQKVEVIGQDEEHGAPDLSAATMAHVKGGNADPDVGFDGAYEPSRISPTCHLRDGHGTLDEAHRYQLCATMVGSMMQEASSQAYNSSPLTNVPACGLSGITLGATSPSVAEGYRRSSPNGNAEPLAIPRRRLLRSGVRRAITPATLTTSASRLLRGVSSVFNLRSSSPRPKSVVGDLAPSLKLDAPEPSLRLNFSQSQHWRSEATAEDIPQLTDDLILATRQSPLTHLPSAEQPAPAQSTLVCAERQSPMKHRQVAVQAQISFEVAPSLADELELENDGNESDGQSEHSIRIATPVRIAGALPRQVHHSRNSSSRVSIPERAIRVISSEARATENGRSSQGCSNRAFRGDRSDTSHWSYRKYPDRSLETGSREAVFEDFNDLPIGEVEPVYRPPEEHTSDPAEGQQPSPEAARRNAKGKEPVRDFEYVSR